MRRQGYRITLDKFGASALKRCLPSHLFELILATASPQEDIGYFRFTNKNLGEIFKLTFKRDPQLSNQEVLGQVDRATLRTILLSGLQDRVHFGKSAARIETRSDCATLHFADGSSTQASIVVGADGVHSLFREQLLPDCPPIDTGYRGIYGKTRLIRNGKSLVPEALKNSGVFAIGKPGQGFFFTTMRFNEPPKLAFARLVPDQEPPPISEDYLMWAIMFPQKALPVDVWQRDAHALHELALKASCDFHPVLQRFVMEADIDYTLVVTLYSSTRPQVWPISRATLMGDAIHVMPPLGAHGGNTALRDAALLAEKLMEVASRGEPLEQAIMTYQEEMAAYAFKEVDAATAMLRRSNTTNSLVRWAMLRAVPWLRSLTGSSLIIDEDSNR
jgi:2-polyprenyl-6-methoxyphenol hydroxylase-like FAD-dependent oxidoreductase